MGVSTLPTVAAHACRKSNVDWGRTFAVTDPPQHVAHLLWFRGFGPRGQRGQADDSIARAGRNCEVDSMARVSMAWPAWPSSIVGSCCCAEPLLHSVHPFGPSMLVQLRGRSHLVSSHRGREVAPCSHGDFGSHPPMTHPARRALLSVPAESASRAVSGARKNEAKRHGRSPMRIGDEGGGANLSLSSRPHSCLARRLCLQVSPNLCPSTHGPSHGLKPARAVSGHDLGFRCTPRPHLNALATDSAFYP